MEIQTVLMNEEKAQEVVIEDDSEPWDLADRLYKEWLEEPRNFEIEKE
ncbi:MAG: hypothetical protein AB2L22_13225 [Syntrophales bacterium]